MTSPPCVRDYHEEWVLLWTDDGRQLALACSVCMATVPVPEAEPGVRLVPIPAEWEADEN